MVCPHCGCEFEVKKRSNKANRRMWGVVVPVCQEILSQGRVLPLSAEQTWELLKGAFLGHEETPLGLVPKGSRDLPPAEYADLGHRIEAHFRAEYAAVFPDDAESIGA